MDKQNNTQSIKGLAYYNMAEDAWMQISDMSTIRQMDTIQKMLTGTTKKESLFEDENFRSLILNLAERISATLKE